jgi:hypothetical protein
VISASTAPSPPTSLPLPPEAPPPPTSIPLPPEATYSSKEELYTSIQTWAAQHHYAFSISRSAKINKGVRTRILYSCDRYGRPPPANHPERSLQPRKRQTATRKTGCQFSVVAIECGDAQWELRHRPGTQNSIHNHPPSHSTSSHPVHRKLAQAEINEARSLHNSGKFNILHITIKRAS